MTLLFCLFMNLILKTNPFNKYVYQNQMGPIRGALELLSYNTAWRETDLTPLQGRSTLQWPYVAEFTPLDTATCCSTKTADVHNLNKTILRFFFLFPKQMWDLWLWNKGHLINFYYGTTVLILVCLVHNKSNFFLMERMVKQRKSCPLLIKSCSIFFFIFSYC